MLQELKAIDQTPVQQQKKKEAKSNAVKNINEAINNSGVDEAKQMVQLQSMQSNQSNQKSKQDKQSMMLQEPRKAIDQTPDATTEELKAK